MKLSLFALLFFAVIDAAFGGFFPKAFKAELEQEVTSQLKDPKTKKYKVRKTPVEMKYLLPSNISFHVKGNEEVLYVCNKERTWIYTPPFMEGEKGECKVGSSSKYCHVKLFDALSHGLQDNPLYKVNSKGAEATLTFSKAAKAQLNITKVQLYFKNDISSKTNGKDLKSLTLFYVDKEKFPVSFVFKKLDEQTLKKSDFEFKIPESTNIVNI